MNYFDNKAGSLIEAAKKIKEKTIEVEGNAFTKALMAAREEGKKTFVVAGKMYRTEMYKKEDNTNNKSDDGEGLDKVQPKAVKKKFDDRKDKDIDNDGDVDSSDKYLHKRRKAISKAVAKEYVEADGTKKRVAEGDKRLKANKEQKEENIVDIQQKKNYTMREALAKIWGYDEGYNYFEEKSMDEGKMKQLHQMIDAGKSAKEIASAMKMDVKTIEKLMPKKESTDSGKKATKVVINPKV